MIHTMCAGYSVGVESAARKAGPYFRIYFPVSSE